jgi:antitoxin MazE
MTTTIQKWGNSLAVRLSKEVAESFSLNEGSVVSVFAKDKEIIIKPAQKTQKYTLDELVKKITPENKHTLVDLGSPKGKEIW